MKTKILVSALLLSLLSGCISTRVIREPASVERVIVVHEYPTTVWSFGFGYGWHGGYYRRGPWRH